MEFTHDAYRNLILKSLKNGYNLTFYQDIDKFDKAIILRHDIDFSPRKALDIAKIEHQLGVKSTYFVLLSTEFYNVFSAQTGEIMDKILGMGHKIGLHFDEQRYKSSSLDQMKDYVCKESKILQKALNTSINVVSMHRPSKFILDKNIGFENIINSYDQLFVRDIKYVSDSRMYWREDIMDIIENNKYNKIHILTHPFWYSDKVENIQGKLLKFLDEAKTNRYYFLYNNFRNLSECIEREDIM